MAIKDNTTTIVRADPSQWSEKSQNSVAFHFIKEYKNIEYNCWRCKKSAVFSAYDQKYTFEVKKASIDQRRSLCQECWENSLIIKHDIRLCEEKWAESKKTLKNDADFLSHWLRLLVSLEEYVPYKPNTAAKNMLKKLINSCLTDPSI
jgi:Probable zinc-ribbon domain